MCYYLIQIWYYWEEKIEVSVLWYADLVVASAGDDKKISLWRINGTSLGTVPVAGKDGGDSAEVNPFLLQFLHSSVLLHIKSQSFPLSSKYILDKWLWLKGDLFYILFENVNWCILAR